MTLVSTISVKAGVSVATSSILEREFQRFSVSIPNGINPEKFTPNGPVSSRFVLEKMQRPLCVRSQRPTVLLVGNPALPLKGKFRVSPARFESRFSVAAARTREREN